MGYSGAKGKLIHEKKPEAKNLVTLSLKFTKSQTSSLLKLLFAYTIFVLCGFIFKSANGERAQLCYECSEGKPAACNVF
jgi:hypothetical protein